MGEGKEMPKQDGRRKDQHRKQRGEILGLDTYPDSKDEPILYQHAVDDAGASLVHVAMKIEINASRQKEQDEKRESGEFTHIQHGVVAPLEGHDFLQMRQKVSR